MMQAIYLIAFTYLLRFDEVLKIQHHHIEVVNPGYEATSGFSSTFTRFTFRFPVLLGGDFDPVLPAPGMSKENLPGDDDEVSQQELRFLTP